MSESAIIPTPPDHDLEMRKPRFISLRWRSILPLTLVVLIVAMIGAYILASNISTGVEVSQVNLLLQSSRAVTERAVSLYERHRTEAQRVAFTNGVPEAIIARQTTSLLSILEGLARAAELDSIIVTDASGVEIAGLQRVSAAEMIDYAVNTGTDLSEQPIVRGVLDDGYVGATGLLRTVEGLLLYTAVPINDNGDLVGLALVGQRLDGVLEALESSALADVSLYGTEGVLLGTSFALEGGLSIPALAPEVYNQALLAVQQLPVQSVFVGDQVYQAAFSPFNFGPGTLGVVGTLVPDSVPYATELGRQLTGLLAALLAGAVVMVAFLGVTRMMGYVEDMTDVMTALAAGSKTVRTGMQASHEIGALGQALDQYADYVEHREDKLRKVLRRQRRQLHYIYAILQSLPDGVVVQDREGRVILMNDQARHLLGSQRVFRDSGIHELAAVASDMLGKSLAPGIYALGDPQRIDLDGRMLRAQAAAIVADGSPAQQRLGTVILMRDITEYVRQEHRRDELLNRLAQDIQQPIAGLGMTGSRSPNDLVNAFAREISRHSAALQKMIVEMRELTNIDTSGSRPTQRQLRLDTLIWAVANDWQQIAQAATLTLHVLIERKGLYVLGDERRLRWAIGNIVDNAIKFTPPGGQLTLEIRGQADGMAHLRVRDNGVGIAADELTHTFTRFYRGHPTTRDGQPIHVPGMGQGLNISRQIFQAHGGSVRLKSKQFVGTAVNMILPLTSAVSMTLPLLDETDMEGETLQLPPDVDIDAFWQAHEIISRPQQEDLPQS